MRYYSYKAITPDGTLIKGTVEGEDIEYVYGVLSTNGLYILNVKAASRIITSLKRGLLKRRVKNRDIIEFANNLSVMLKAGIPLLTALDDTTTGLENRYLKNAITDIISQTRAGMRFSDAVASHKDIFPEMFARLTKVGEETGDIDKDAASESLVSYASSNKRLPTTTEFTNAVRNPNDAWTKSLFYVTDTNLTTITSPAIEAICGRSTTNLTVQTCPDAACASPTNTIPDVAFIIISGGANNNNQTAGTQAVSSATTISVYDVDVANIDDYSGDIGGARPEAYDDIVKWTTLNELRTKSGCDSAPLSIQTTALASGFRCGVYSATVYAEGGVPYSSGGSYKWCTQGTLPGGITLSPNVTSTDCTALSEASWGQANYLTLTASAAALYPTGIFSLTFFVRDNNDSAGSSDNTAQKQMPLVVGEYGNMIRIWNETGATYDFLIDGRCRDSIANGNEISQTNLGRLLRPGQSCYRYASAGTCNTFSGQYVTYDQAIDVDADCDYEANFTLAGATDR